jgi:hypothetical protein
MTNQITTTETKPTPRVISPKVNRILYAGFMIFGLVAFFIYKDPIQAMSQFGIALIFDPFDPKVPFQERKLYQRIWLFVHAFLVIGLLIWMFVAK